MEKDTIYKVYYLNLADNFGMEYENHYFFSMKGVKKFIANEFNEWNACFNGESDDELKDLGLFTEPNELFKSDVTLKSIMDIDPEFRDFISKKLTNDEIEKYNDSILQSECWGEDRVFLVVGDN